MSITAARRSPASDAPHVSTRGGRFLTFFLGDEEYGLEILIVQEIIGMQPITRVPRTPSCFRGVINLRGKVIPIVDLRERFGLSSSDVALAELTDAEREAELAARCIIVVQAPGVRVDGAPNDTILVGLMVDRVSEVAWIADDDIDDAPSFGADARTEYLLGLGKSQAADGSSRVRLLLDIQAVLATDATAHAAEREIA